MRAGVGLDPDGIEGLGQAAEALAEGGVGAVLVDVRDAGGAVDGLSDGLEVGQKVRGGDSRVRNRVSPIRMWV